LKGFFIIFIVLKPLYLKPPSVFEQKLSNKEKQKNIKKEIEKIIKNLYDEFCLDTILLVNYIARNTNAIEWIEQKQFPLLNILFDKNDDIAGLIDFGIAKFDYFVRELNSILYSLARLKNYNYFEFVMVIKEYQEHLDTKLVFVQKHWEALNIRV
jgi:hypothetical protein